MYPASTEPAMVANPPVMTACNSDLVMSFNKGRIISGASVYKTLLKDSVRDTCPHVTLGNSVGHHKMQKFKEGNLCEEKLHLRK